jgi:hypothetical protein
MQRNGDEVELVIASLDKDALSVVVSFIPLDFQVAKYKCEVKRI